MDFNLPVVFNEDNPEWTKEDFAKARPAREILAEEVVAALTSKQDRPTLAEGERKKQITLSISPKVLAHYRATGRGWQARINETLEQAISQ
jgi:uncharacterized protein (DUF4415 family)